MSSFGEKNIHMKPTINIFKFIVFEFLIFILVNIILWISFQYLIIPFVNWFYSVSLFWKFTIFFFGLTSIIYCVMSIISYIGIVVKLFVENIFKILLNQLLIAISYLLAFLNLIF